VHGLVLTTLITGRGGLQRYGHNSSRVSQDNNYIR